MKTFKIKYWDRLDNIQFTEIKAINKNRAEIKFYRNYKNKWCLIESIIQQ